MLKKNNTFLLGLMYFLILMLIALLVRDFTDQQDSFNTVQQLMASSLLGDPISFATGAIEVSKYGWITKANDWIFNLWPPGFILLEALILKLFGTEINIILILQILASLLFSVVLVLTYQTLKKNLSSQLAMSLPLVIFAFPVSRVFLLEPTGVTLGESFAIGFFLITILLTFRAVENNSISNSIYAGLCLALSAYFRSQFDIILLGLTAWGALLVIAVNLTLLKKYFVPDILKSSVKTIVILLIAAHITTLPWRLYHYINHGVAAWVSTPKLTFANSVLSSQELESKGGGFVVEGAGNLTCRIDPTACGDLKNAQKLFFKTLIQHPVEWFTLKFQVIGKYWFSAIDNWTSPAVKSSLGDILINGSLLFGLILLIALLFTKKVRCNGLWVLLLWLNISLISAYMLIFTLAHFEVRYFYFPKIAILLQLPIVLSIYFKQLSLNRLMAND